MGINNFFYILEGSWITLKYMLFSLLCGAFLGLFLALLKMSSHKTLRSFAHIYTSVFRGTPLLVQLSLVYFGVPQFIHCQISAFLAGVLAFSLNSGAYLSETILGGIRSIDPGQFEAARVLNIPYFYTMKDIILPQVIRNTLPSLGNEAIALLKETALISTLGEDDLMRRSQLVSAEQYTYFMPLLIAAGGYYGMVVCLSFMFKQIQKRLSL